MSRKFRERGGRVVAAECTLCSDAEGRTVLRPLADFQRSSGSPLGVQARCRDCRRGAARTRNGRIRRMLHDARWNAAHAGRRCTITYADIGRAFGDRCAVTGLPFDMGVTVVGGRLKNHNAPSLDRRDAARGYVAGNIQVVLAWVNQAKGRGTQRQFNRRLRLGAVGQTRHIERWQRPPQGISLRSIIG
jgi:hypothetical protein